MTGSTRSQTVRNRLKKFGIAAVFATAVILLAAMLFQEIGGGGEDASPETGATATRPTDELAAADTDLRAEAERAAAATAARPTRPTLDELPAQGESATEAAGGGSDAQRPSPVRPGFAESALPGAGAAPPPLEEDEIRRRERKRLALNSGLSAPVQTASDMIGARRIAARSVSPAGAAQAPSLATASAFAPDLAASAGIAPGYGDLSGLSAGLAAPAGLSAEPTELDALAGLSPADIQALIAGAGGAPAAAAGQAAYLPVDAPEDDVIPYDPAPGRHLLARATVIPAVTTTRINTTGPALVGAVTTRPVFDTLTSRHLLIPRGSFLVGEFGDTSVGQRRLQIHWTDLREPGGAAIVVDGFGTVGGDGIGGVKGKRNAGFLTTLGIAAALDLADNASEILIAIITGEEPEQEPETAADVLRDLLLESGGSSVSRVTDRYLEEFLKRGTQFKVKPGTNLNVQVARDLYLPALGPNRAASR